MQVLLNFYICNLSFISVKVWKLSLYFMKGKASYVMKGVVFWVHEDDERPTVFLELDAEMKKVKRNETGLCED